MYARNVSATTDLILTDTKNSAASKSTGANSEYARLLKKQIAQLNSAAPKEIETVKRFRPDGTITITTYEDGDYAGQIKIKPHMVPTPDFSAPPHPDGSPQMKFEPRFNLLELLMM